MRSARVLDKAATVVSEHELDAVLGAGGVAGSGERETSRDVGQGHAMSLSTGRIGFMRARLP